jgi:hypothetical protein
MVDENTAEVSTYKGEPATDTEISECVTALTASYPTMKAEFFGVLASRLKAECWPAKRIQDAITHVIDTCKYPTFTIADIMSFDRPMKLYTYGGYCWLIDKGMAQDEDGCGEKSDFGNMKIGEKVFFYLKKDLPVGAQKRT